jgi:hypothetical protein
MLNQATSKFEHAVVAPLLLLNGGGAVAYLTLLGAINSKQPSTLGVHTSWIAPALVMWAL